MTNPTDSPTTPPAALDKEHVARDANGFISNAVAPERAILGQLHLDERPSHFEKEDETTDESSLEELAGLAEAAGAVVAGQVFQKRSSGHPATLFGKGKVEEVERMCRELDAHVFIVDCDLSPAQGRNLESALKVRVIDRTELILDIFARRAKTRQASLQVELAQLRYQLPRLKRMWTHLDSQAGGGIGLRGPGETQLETDKRLAGTRIALLEAQLQTIRKQKQVESGGRNEFDTGALVGYTNVGKSALLNALSRPFGDGVLVRDQLFATLGSSTRKIELGGGRAILLSDTVGFVRRLPHHLVECFHSTLAEVEDAAFLLHVVSAADAEREDKMHAVERVLGELKVMSKPTLLVVNQCDLISPDEREALRHRFPEAVFTSALTGEGLHDLRERVRALLEEGDEEIELSLDAREASTGRLLAEIARHGRVLHQEWNGAPDALRLQVRARLSPRWKQNLPVSKR